MKQKLLIFFGIILLIILLIGLNAASYVQKETPADSEIFPNRSSYHAGATGTRAFYDLLAETGHNVSRWQESPSALLLYNQKTPDTLIIIGQTRREFEENETADILNWVAQGGKLVIIDREPPKEFITTTANWSVSLSATGISPYGLDPSDQNQMTDKTAAAKPAQPTVFTKQVNAVQPSRLAGRIVFERFDILEEEPVSDAPPEPSPLPTFAPSDGNSQKSGKEPIILEEKFPEPDSDRQTENKNEQDIETDAAQPPPPAEIQTGKPADEVPETLMLSAPVVHLTNGEKDILVDVPFGEGRIVFLTDPFIVSNGGINLVDNAQLAINIAASREGIIAFDEYHQGYGAGENRFLQYFAGTPVFAIFGQIVLLIGLIFLSQSRRFARPLPLDEPDRLSKLEYVAAMAELQRRTKGYDLAIENIYTDFRRRVSRFLGVDNQSTSRKELARLLSERLNRDELEIYNLMRKCEDIMHGEPTGKKQVLELVSRLRGIEETLGLKRTGRKL